ncbi:DUF2147 domain-containing protein [Mesorhizobium sp. CN2-181]|uniref:DUF2147 domain-containing protein n=1 Tax=Mesorhizobium yinganensis TaxID=3157707 RepID=UPI0032B7F08B
MRWMTVFVAGLWLLPQLAMADATSNASGVWNRDDGNARVRIAPCGKSLCATNLWIGDTSKGEAVGDKLIMTLTPKSATTLTGKAYDPKRNLTYAISLQVTGKRLKTRGCVVGGLICKDVFWTPAKP